MDPNKAKALDAAMSQIERQFGKGTVMRMGDQERVALPAYFHRLTWGSTSPSVSVVCPKGVLSKFTARSRRVKRP